MRPYIWKYSKISTNRLYQIPPDAAIVSSSENILLNRIDLHVKLPEQERICPNCGFHSCVIKDSGRERTVRHLPVSNRSTFVTYRSRRFFYKDRRASYFEPIDWIHDSLRMTAALAVDIRLELTGMKSIHDIAQKEIVTDETVSAVFRLVSFDRPAQLPKNLCVDEFKGDSGNWNPSRNRWDTHKFQCNITDGAAGVLIDILPAIKEDYLVAYFQTLVSGGAFLREILLLFVVKMNSLNRKTPYARKYINIHLWLDYNIFYRILGSQGQSRSNGAKGTLYFLVQRFQNN